MITVTGRRIALVICICSGALVVGMGVFGFVRGHLTPHEVIAGAVVLLVAVVAALWLRRQNLNEDDGDAPMNRSEDPYGCHPGKGGGRP